MVATAAAASIPWWQTAGGAAAISAGGSLLGGMLGGSSGVPKSSYREAATQTMQAKIRTAKQMGVHPLYALGAATPGPIQKIPGQSLSGSIAKDAANAISQAVLNKAALAESRAKVNLLEAQAAAINKEVNTTGGSPHGATGGNPAQSFALEYQPKQRIPQADQVWDQRTGKWMDVTPEKMRMDMTEAIGGYIDQWIRNPHMRRELERRGAAVIKDIPGIRHALRGRKSAIELTRRFFEWHGDRYYKNRGRPKANAPTPYKSNPFYYYKD